MKLNRKAQQVSLISLLIMIFIVAIIGTSLIVPISDTTNATISDGNISASQPSVTLLSFNTLMFTLLILSGVVGLSFLTMRLVGLI